MQNKILLWIQCGLKFLKCLKEDKDVYRSVSESNTKIDQIKNIEINFIIIGKLQWLKHDDAHWCFFVKWTIISLL